MQLSITRSTITRLYSEVRRFTNLPVTERYSLHYSQGSPKYSVGVVGDWAIDTKSQNVFLKTALSWVNIIEALARQRKQITIYKSSKTTPPTPTDNINIGWTDREPPGEPIHAHLWQSTATYLGSTRISLWTSPSIFKRGSKVEKQVEIKKTVHVIFIAHVGRPPLNRRENDPTQNSEWTYSESEATKAGVPIWASRAVKDQDGNLIGIWSVPTEIDKGEFELSVDTAGTILQKYSHEADSEARPVATREQIIQQIKEEEIENGAVTNEKLGESAVQEINISSGAVNASKLNIDIHILM